MHEPSISEMTRKRVREELECPCLIGYCEKHPIEPDELLKVVDEAIMKVKKIINGHPNTSFTAEEYMKYYSCAFSLCCWNNSQNRGKQLYEKFMGAMEESIGSVVLPSLENKDHAPFLAELLQMWSNYKTMAHWLSRFFGHLDRSHLESKKTSLSDVSIYLFCNLVCDALWGKIQDAVIHLINQERDGMLINRDLLKSVIDFFVEIEKKGRRKYYEDFEQVMLTDAASYYSQLASEWLLCDSFSSYIRKVGRCLNNEERRTRHYLPQNTMAKLLEALRSDFLDKNAINNIVQLVSHGM